MADYKILERRFKLFLSERGGSDDLNPRQLLELEKAFLLGAQATLYTSSGKQRLFDQLVDISKELAERQEEWQ